MFDGSLAGYGLLNSPLRVQLEARRAAAAEGEAADWLLSTLDAGGEHGRSIAEIGIGTNGDPCRQHPEGSPSERQRCGSRSRRGSVTFPN